MRKNETNNGKKGGLLKGKPHYDENGKPLGGIKAIVTDTNTPVELEGGEVIINKHASKKYWKELSKINQSAGNGVPIKNPNGGDDEDPEEYKDGGRIIDFNPNHLPNKRILTYAKKIKSDYPKVWDLGGNIFGNEAFKNLQRVSERGYWLESEKWMYIKWRSFVARHTHDFRIKGVIAMLKWVDKVDKGWDYMKDLIEAEIEKKYSSKMAKGGRTISQTPSPIKDRIYGSDVNKKHSSESLSSAESIKFSSITLEKIENIVDEHNKNYPNLKITLSSAKAVVRRGMGAYSSSHRPTIKGGKPNSRVAWGLARLNAFIYKIVNGKSKSGKYNQDDDLINELGYNVDKYADSGKIEKVMKQFKEGKLHSGSKKGPIVKNRKQAIAIALSEERRQMENGGDVSEENAEMVRNQNKQILHHTEELKKVLESGVEVPAWVVAKINRATNDISDATHYLDGTLRYAYGGEIKSGQVFDWNKYGVENTIAVTDIKDGMVFYRFNGVPKVRGTKEFVKLLEEHNLKSGFQFKQGGELEIGIKEEKEHINTARDLYERKITPSESAEKIAKDHLKEDPHYYSKLKNSGLGYGGALVEAKDKVDLDTKSDIFVNSIVFKSELDYVLGGFNVESLNAIIVKDDLTALNMPKLEFIFTERLQFAIENFKDEISTNLLKKNPMIDSIEIESDMMDEFNNLFETYLGFSFYSTNTNDIIEKIKSDTSYITWMSRVERGLEEFKNKLRYQGSDINHTEQSNISVKEAEELTTNSTFEQMLEKLFYINQENTI